MDLTVHFQLSYNLGNMEVKTTGHKEDILPVEQKREAKVVSQELEEQVHSEAKVVSQELEEQEHSEAKVMAKEVETDNVEVDIKDVAVQMASAFAINLVALLQGASVSSSSVILHSLQENLSPEHNSTTTQWSMFRDFAVTADEGSWVAASWVLAHLLCAPLAGFLSDQIGRRKALMIDTSVLFLGFALLTASTSLPWLILARFLLGCPLVSQVRTPGS